MTGQTKKIDIAQLFSAGTHFGFTKRRRHPSVVPYLFGTKEGNDIIDLAQTSEQLAAAAAVVAKMAAADKQILYVGTKDEVAKLVHTAALRANAPYVSNRWIGGLLTNFAEVKKRLHRLHELQQDKASGEWERKYTKKERVMLGRELTKLEFNFGGIQQLTKAPDLLVVVDPRFESIALAEAEMLGIPVIAIAGTDCNIAPVTHPVVMNDALQSSVSLALDYLVAAQTAAVQSTVAPSSAPARTTATA